MCSREMILKSLHPLRDSTRKTEKTLNFYRFCEKRRIKGRSKYGLVTLFSAPLTVLAFNYFLIFPSSHVLDVVLDLRMASSDFNSDWKWSGDFPGRH